MIMTIFGYIIYLLFTGAVTVLAGGVCLFFPTGTKIDGEKLFLLAIMGVFWYGAYWFWPFEAIVLK